ncbi:MAG TPA: YhcH/YjgK/YiaL family protein [Anaerolineales bacterium]|nr:YhcH/YjgK/YiaL family protein [Anaerolineales bacterium]
MIFDRLANSRLYENSSPRLREAFEYLQRTDLSALPVGRQEIDGQNMYAMVQEYSPKPPEGGRWEAHRLYIDLQYLVSGKEQIGFAPIGRLAPGEYDPARDFTPLEGRGDLLTVSAGEFMLLFPEDAHMPGLAAGAPGPVRKVVVKIKVD